ncbi:hypothetical protein AaE_002544 [Aphanomyces astaci]|uniref:folate gamma-glutamyl hydrolase n=1 Tax=Aphanomyces astaci TaxID=112090 RepID=A0A6A5AYH4_APHAT|nr:hypothetical protein AaE_002544 [Aphanomyces astaci]
MTDERKHLVVAQPPRTPSRKPPVREGHYGVKCLLVGLSVVSVVVICIAVRFLPLPASPGQPGVPSFHRLITANPIVGILSQPSTTHPEYEFIASSYVKWVESAGGRAVRIPFNASNDTVADLLGSVNGVLFPSGDADPNRVAAFTYRHAKELNRNGTHFPLWGTGLGMQWLFQLESPTTTLLDDLDVDKMSSTLEFIHGSRSSSRLFGFSAVFDVMAGQPIADYVDTLGMLVDHLYAAPSLASFFRPLATSVDRQGREFVAAVEAVEFPFFGVQFHPERNAYEFGQEAVDHTYNAIVTSQALSHVFVNEARRNDHRFATSLVERTALLYNRKASDVAYPMFEEVLLFNATLD